MEKGEHGEIEVRFKRRNINQKRKSRKRLRPEKEQEPNSDEEKAPLQLEKNGIGIDKSSRDTRILQREEFQATKEVVNPDIGKTSATAQRGDVGGDSATKQKKPYGPLSAPTHLRTSVRMDYQPDVCKDYKETGYCGFGDSCKFLHDRTDYKSGWQLEKDWVTKQKERREKILKGEDPDAETSKESSNINDADGLPFACHICRQSFKNPVETLCKHYFCEKCALNRMKSDSTCAVCHAQLRGILNTAQKLLEKLKKTSEI